MSSSLSTKGPRQLQPLLRPFQALREEIEQTFNRLSSDWDGKWVATGFTPPCDLSETPDAYHVRMDVPGIKPEEITVQVTGESVRISGERREEKEEQDKMYHRVERRSGSFCEVIQLPGAVKEETVQAEFQDSVLTVTLPKSEATRTRTVKVKAGK